MQPAKRFAFSVGKPLDRVEVERLYSFLQAQLDSLQRDFDSVSGSYVSQSDYSTRLDAIERQMRALSASLSELRTAIDELPETLDFRLADSDNRLVVSTPSGDRQVLLAPYT